MKEESPLTCYSTAQLSKIHPVDSELDCEEKAEKFYHILIQTLIPFLIAGLGMVGAGIYLNYLEHSTELFIQVGEILILVPSLLGLKGNLEMTLAARLSTKANLGILDKKSSVFKVIIGNICLTQLQSIVVGLLASIVACVTALIKERTFQPMNLLILLTSSITTASFASLFLGILIISIVLISKRYNLNPDNIATPIASFGDIVTLFILSLIGSVFHKYCGYYWIHIIIISIYTMLLPVFFYICYKNEFVKETLYQGWVPIIIAMFISSFAGILIDIAVEEYPNITKFQPVANGAGGNLVSIFASRLSTALFSTSTPGKWAAWAPKRLIMFPYETFFGKTNYESDTAKVLLSLALPGHLIFFFAVFYIRDAEEGLDLTAGLVLFYLLICFIQVLVLLLICYFLVHLVWRMEKNPDNICIPLLTSSGDLIGTSFLILCFFLAYVTGNTSLINKVDVKKSNITRSVQCRF